MLFKTKADKVRVRFVQGVAAVNWYHDPGDVVEVEAAVARNSSPVAWPWPPTSRIGLAPVPLECPSCGMRHSRHRGRVFGLSTEAAS